MKNVERRLKHRLKAPLLSFKAGAHIGFENTLAKELSILGISQCQPQSGCAHFTAKLEQAWQAITLSRCARSFEMKIAQFHCENFGKLEHEIKNIDWELYLPQSGSASVKAFCEKSRLYHEGAVEERVSLALGNLIGHGIRINVRLESDVCYIWLDLCGEPLRKRGGEECEGEGRWVEDAPMQETLAASILLYSDFAKHKKLIDPMAGSGVFSLEALKWRSSSALERGRSFSFMKMPSFREAAYNNFLKNAKQPFALGESESFEIVCGDKSPKAVKTIEHNLQTYSSKASISQMDFFSLAPARDALLLLNPPYGKRLGREANLYGEIAAKIEKDFKECKAAILCPFNEIKRIKAASSRSFETIQTFNGGLKTALLVFESLA